MSAYDRFTCELCGNTFAAHPDGNAATNGYCSPVGETAGKGLGYPVNPAGCSSAPRP